jgi:transmembrane 9 superfamily protein 2/4
MSISNRKCVKACLLNCLLVVQLLTTFQPRSLMVNAFYVPGVAPQDFSAGDLVDVKVSFFEMIFGPNVKFMFFALAFLFKAVKLTSSKTQLPYEYYNIPIHCRPSKKITYKSENLGEILRGDRIVNTGYEIKMNVEEQCRVLCKEVELSADETKRLRKKIKDNYHVHL